MTTKKKTYSADEVMGTPTIGEFLDILRESEEIDLGKEISKKDWAKRLGMKPQEYNYYLNEGASMSVDKAIKVARTGDLDENILIHATMRHSLLKAGKNDIDVQIVPKIIASANL